MIEEIKNISATKTDLRKYGFLMAGVLFAIAMFMLWKQFSNYNYVLYVSIVFFVLGLLVPIALKPIYFVWMTLATILGWIMTRVILTILFYLIVTPIGLISRLFGAKFLDFSWRKGEKSHWNFRDKSENNLEKQF